MSETLVDVWVPGKARPKGSLKVQGRRLVESNDDSKPWRAQMAAAFLSDWWMRCGQDRAPRWTLPVIVEWSAFFTRPAGCELVAPTSAAGAYATGDKDKLERNILDALQGAAKGAPGVLADDAQVIFATGTVHWCDDTPQGLYVRVSAPSDAEIRAASRIANIGMQRILSQRGLLGPTGF